MKNLTTIILIFALLLSSCGNVINEFAGGMSSQQTALTPSEPSDSSEPSEPPITLPPSVGGGVSSGGNGSVYTLTLKANDGTSAQRVIRAASGINVTLTNTFTRAYCDFAGWAASRAGAAADSYNDGAVIPMTGNMTLYALWTVTGSAADVVSVSGSVITVTGVSWSDELKAAIEAALSSPGMTLDLGGVSGPTTWDNSIITTASSNNIKNLVLPDTVTALNTDNQWDPRYNENIQSLSGAGVTDIGGYALAVCTALANVNLPLVTNIGEHVFDNCTALASLNLPLAASIGFGAFRTCTSLASVNLPAAASIGEQAFIFCSSLTSVNLPLATSIGEQAFRYCHAIASVNLPLAASIGDSAFRDTALASIRLPAAASIGKYAFQGCIRLDSVTLPSAASIDEHAFRDCTALAALTLGAEPPALGTAPFADTGSSGTITIHVGSGNVSAYTTEWGVNASTAANGSISVYGNNHKAINITE